MRLPSNYPRMALDALLLRDSAYADMRDGNKPFVRGMIFIAVLGVAIALAGITGHLLEWAVAPNLSAIKETVWEHLIKMPWYEGFSSPPAGVLESIRDQYEYGWRIANFFAPNPWRSAMTLISTPLGLLVGWLIYGLLAHLYSRTLGGEGTFAQTYGCVALATSAQALRLANLVPYVRVGGIVAVWGLLCNFVALKAAHKLSGGRAFWAAILPVVTIWLLALLLGVAIIVAFGSVLPGIMEQVTGMGGIR